MKKSIPLNLLMFTLGSSVLVSAKAQDDLVYVAVEPCRIVDTRNAGGAIGADTSRNFRVSGTMGELAAQGGTTDCLDPKAGAGLKPLAATAYVIAVPDVGTGAGVLSAYPSGQMSPPVGSGSTVNFSPGQVIGNTTTISLCSQNACPSDGDLAILARNTDQHVVVDVQGYFYPLLIEGTCSTNASTRFVDNGDGTICDRQTGLMWEMKNASDSNVDLNNPRDMDNNYTWASTIGGTAPDGTAYTDFLARLNNTVAASKFDTPFARHTDWRIPTLSELQTIVDCSVGSPCIDPIFGPTAETIYWSSTSNGNNLAFAWLINFFDGNVLSFSKGTEIRMRAVRGGR